MCLIRAPAPSHGHLVPPPQRCHGVSSADPLVEGRVPLGVPLPCLRVVRPWPSFQGVTQWSGLVALCLRCRSVVCLAGGQRGQPRVAWMTGGGALLPLVTESVLAVHEVIFFGFVLNRRRAAGHRSEYNAVYFKSITKPPLSSVLTAGQFCSLSPSSCPSSPAWAPSLFISHVDIITGHGHADMRPEAGSQE